MDYGITVIGAGVVGLAVAAEVASRTSSLLVIERHASSGQETSSHNSEVLHAGLYYPPGSLKARLCVYGNALLQELHNKQGIPLKLLGKLVVGREGEEDALEALFVRATLNGASGVRRLSRSDIATLEPNLFSTLGIYSSNTGILDSHALMRYYQHIASERGVDFAYRTEVQNVSKISGGYEVQTRSADGETFQLTTEVLINCAGLMADKIAAMVGINIHEAGLQLYPCRGDYFSTRPRCWSWVSHLVYPIPGAKAAGLGIHVTLDMAGRMRLGPDATYLAPDAPLSYAVDGSKREAFAIAVQRYLPLMTAEDLEPELSGIRPKLQGPGQAVRDFVIQEESSRGFPGLINLIGIESPGLTASPAIARTVRDLLAGKKPQ